MIFVKKTVIIKKKFKKLELFRQNTTGLVTSMRKSKLNTTFPKRLYELRQASSMTQMKLAGKINVSRSCLANYESGKRFPDMSIIELIASVFNVSKEYLLDEEEPYHPPNNNRFKSVKGGLLCVEKISTTSKIALVEFCNFLEDEESRKPI